MARPSKQTTYSSIKSSKLSARFGINCSLWVLNWTLAHMLTATTDYFQLRPYSLCLQESRKSESRNSMMLTFNLSLLSYATSSKITSL